MFHCVVNKAQQSCCSDESPEQGMLSVVQRVLDQAHAEVMSGFDGGIETMEGEQPWDVRLVLQRIRSKVFPDANSSQTTASLLTVASLFRCALKSQCIGCQLGTSDLIVIAPHGSCIRRRSHAWA